MADETTIETNTKRHDGAVWINGGRLYATTAAGILAIRAGEILGSGIALKTISESNIADRAITTVKVALGAIQESLIAAGAVTETKIDDDAITSPKIFAGAVVAGKIGANAVYANNIIAGAVTTVKIAVSGVAADRIAANAIVSSKIAANAIQSIHIAAYQVIAEKIGSGTIDTQKITLSGTGANGIIEIDAQTSNNRPTIRVAKQGVNLALFGNLKEETGVEEYGLWVKSGAAYIGGYRLYEAVVDAGGDGDYTTIKDAVDAGKTRIFVRNGTYTLAADITISNNDVTIIGESRDGVIINSGATSTKYKILVTGHRCTLSNFTKDRGPSSEWSIKASGDDCHIYNVKIEDSDSHSRGIYFAVGADNGIVNNCIIKVAVWGIYCAGDFTKITDNYFDSGDGGELMISGDNNVFSRNTCKRTGSTNTAGIDITGINNICADNYVYHSSTTNVGIYVNGNYNKISNNYIENFEKGIYVGGDIGITITNNTIYNSAVTGIYVISSSTAGEGFYTISNNVVYSSGTTGIKLSYGFRIVCTSNAVYGSGGNGIEREDVTFREAIISNNMVQGCAGAGFSFRGTYQAIRCSFVGNMSLDNGTYGFDIKDYECVIGNNLANGNGTANYNVDADASTIYAHNYG